MWTRVEFGLASNSAFRLVSHTREYAPAMSDDAKQWNKLLQAITEGVVIAAVGRDLPGIEADSHEQNALRLPRRPTRKGMRAGGGTLADLQPL